MCAVYNMADEQRPSTSFEGKHRNKSEYNPKLDIFSSEFDPLEALKNSDKVQLPCPDAKVFDNVSTWYSHYKGQDAASKNEPKKDETAVVGQRRWLDHQLPIASTKHVKKSKNIFTKMEQGEGVFKALRKYKDEKSRIKVITRDDRGIRGYCIATLLAFDKHWNLLLSNIDEVWTRRKKYKTPVAVSVDSRVRVKNSLKPPKIDVIKSCSKTEECRRHVNQMMMRGEDVVLITPIDNNTNFQEDLDLVLQRNQEKNQLKEKLSKLLAYDR